MALIECSECGREISDKANACPGCGAPVGSAFSPAMTSTGSASPTGTPAANADQSNWMDAARAIAVFGRTAGGKVACAAKSTGEMAAEASQYAGKMLGRAAVLAGDLNGDGKVDEEDARIAMAMAKEFGSKVADEGGILAKEVAKHEMFKDAAAGAAIGAAIAIPLPIIGPIGGAAIGAMAGLYKHIKTDTKIIINSTRQNEEPTK